MTNSDQDAKNRIFKAAAEILDEVNDVEKVTVRQIAERAGIGTGLINYHFKTKDNLLRIVVEDSLAKMATNFIVYGNDSTLDPVTKLKAMLQELYTYAERHDKLIQFILKQEIQNGRMQTPLYLLPVLREIYGDRKNEMDLRVISLQILLPIQFTSIHPSGFRMFSGIDLRNVEERNEYIGKLVDNLAKQ